MSRIIDALRSGWFVLAVLGAVSLVRGAFYVPQLVDHGDRAPTVENYAPLWVWATMWAGAGAFAIGCALARRWMEAGVGVMVAVPTMWVLLYLLAWIFGDSRAGYITALTYGATVFLITAYYALLSAVSAGDRGGDAPSTPRSPQ